MKNFNEIKTNFTGFIQEFDNMVNDNFGKRLQQNELNSFLERIDMLVMKDEEINAQMINIKMLLNEARIILPTVGF